MLPLCETLLHVHILGRREAERDWVQGQSQKWPKEGEKLSKEGVLKTWKCCRCMPKCLFVRVLVEMTKKIGPMGGGF